LGDTQDWWGEDKEWHNLTESEEKAIEGCPFQLIQASLAGGVILITGFKILGIVQTFILEAIRNLFEDRGHPPQPFVNNAQAVV
jgi:hypothetical protein